MLYPQGIKCAVCGRDIFGDNIYGICSGCSFKANIRFCPKCGRAIGATSKYCDQCTTTERAFSEARAPFIFEGNAKLLVHRLKYGGAKYVAKIIAQYLADEYYKLRWEIDYITFVPMHPLKLKERGYNQACLIASALSEIVNVPLIDALERTKFSKNFARLGRKERMEEAKDSFKAKEKLKKKRILLVDDVFTTGATSNACALALGGGSANEVYVLTFCTAQCKTELY